MDENRTTEFTYNADGNQETITAVNPATGDQVTTYVRPEALEEHDQPDLLWDA